MLGVGPAYGTNMKGKKQERSRAGHDIIVELLVVLREEATAIIEK